MVQEARVACTNCGEGILATYVMVKALRRSPIAPACPYCGDTEALAKLVNHAVDVAGHRQAFLIAVRVAATGP